MFKLLLTALIFLLSGCSSKKDPHYTQLAKKELEHEYALGTLPGTPENLALIKASKEKREFYLKKAKD